MDFRQLPVFLFPSSLNFYLNAKHTHKQLLTLYNPYDFPVRYKVLCNASSKYTVIEPEGSIRPHGDADIVVRHTLPIAANCNIIDKFRLVMQDYATAKVLGKRDIEARLLQGEPDNNSNDGGDDFQALPRSGRLMDKPANASYEHDSRHNLPLAPTNTAIYVSIIVGALSIIGLLMPTKEEKPEKTPIPTWLHLSVHLKLVFAFVLGIVSVVLIRLH